MARVKKVHRTPSSHLGPLRAIEMHGMRKGRSGNKTWFYVGTGLWTLRTVRRMAERREELLISEALKPGERIIIANDRATIEAYEPRVPSAPKGRRARRLQRKADAKQAKIDAKAAEKAAKKAAKKAGKRSRKRTAPAET